MVMTNTSYRIGERISELIQDVASLYEAFEPIEAKRIADKLEIHYTPKHGSWLNMAEIELSHLNRQCLDRRIADNNILVEEVTAWCEARNEKKVIHECWLKPSIEISRD